MTTTNAFVKKTGNDRLQKIKLKAKTNMMRQQKAAMALVTKEASKKQASRPMSRSSTDNNKVRNVQRLIARHVSQKTFMHPDSTSKLEILERAKEEQAGVEYRAAHLHSAQGNEFMMEKRPSRVAEFLSKYSQSKREETTDTAPHTIIRNGSLKIINRDIKSDMRK